MGDITYGIKQDHHVKAVSYAYVNEDMIINDLNFSGDVAYLYVNDVEVLGNGGKVSIKLSKAENKIELLGYNQNRSSSFTFSGLGPHVLALNSISCN